MHAEIEYHAAAKLNLGLHVLRKRPDGYHELETVFLRLPWAERITARPADRLVLTCTDPSLPTDETNLCLQAAHRLAEAFGVPCGAALHLEKSLPYGAGLGSGSSDAATTLRLLADLWGLEASLSELRAIGEGIGSDVPFFLGPSAAYGTGRGEVLTPLFDTHGDPYRLPFDLVVVVPEVHVSTPEAYRRVTPNDRDRPDLRDVVASNDLARWRAELRNDFEAPVAAAYPAVEAALRALRDAGADYASLSGSGAAVFGVFEQPATALAAAEAAELTGHRVWHGRM